MDPFHGTHNDRSFIAFSGDGYHVHAGGGHGPMRWRTLAEFLNELNMLYGVGAIPMVYGITLLLLGGYLLVKNRKGQNRQQKRKSCF